MSAIEETRLILDQLAPRLEEQGYTVYFEPPRQLLPAFMEGYIPDAIALRAKGEGREKKNLAIEIKGGTTSARVTPADLARRFASEGDWELRVYYAPPAARSESVPQMPPEAIDSALSSIETLIAGDQLQAALLLGWSTFEALGRALAPMKFGRPQTPASLVEALANDGLVTPLEAETLRSLSAARNQVAHGVLNKNIGRADLSNFIGILATLREILDSSSNN